MGSHQTPLITGVEPQREPDADGAFIWRLRFETAAGGTAETTVRVRPYGRLRDPNLPWTTMQWSTEGYKDRSDRPGQPPLFTGSFQLRPRFEGTWTTFSLVIQPDEWPEEFPPRFLAADAAAVTDLEREAAGRVPPSPE